MIGNKIGNFCNVFNVLIVSLCVFLGLILNKKGLINLYMSMFLFYYIWGLLFLI